MQRVISVLTLLFFFTLLPVITSAGWFSGDTLVTINGTEYSNDEFKQWWKFWKEKDQPLPESADFYVDWLLLKEEAERMDIANTPTFNRQERIFLQSRGLLMLKNEAVDSQIDVTDEQIRARYEEKYLPLWLVQQLTFADEGAAAAAWQKLQEEKLTVAQLLNQGIEENGPVSHKEKWIRRAEIDSGWEEIFTKTPTGDVVDPKLHKHGTSLFYIKERGKGSEDDLAYMRDHINETLRREQEDLLTSKLLDDLMNRYAVKIDEGRLAALDLNADDNSFTDEPVITTNKENVSEKQFMAVVRKQEKTRPTAVMARADKEKAQSFKLETARNIIHQSVTNWGTLDRHFEQEEPFKSLYQFNYNYRLVSMLENSLFQLKSEPSEEEIAQLYKEKAKYFTVPAQVKLYIVDETQGPIDKIWAEVAVGKKFDVVVRELLTQPVQSIETPLNHLDPQVKDVVYKLAEGETSQIFEAQGDKVLVHLVSRTPERPLPLEQIKQSLLSGYKRESFDKAREAYIAALRANAKIDVDEGNWKVIQRELGGA